MEEEIIIPEEETFDYNKLRYILNNDGYLCNASLGGEISCDLGECTEYNGEIPEGYETIEEWYEGESERLNAWKIVNGNLVYDENRYAELQKQYEIEQEENTLSTHKWVNDRLKVSNSVVTDELAVEKTGTSLIILNDAGNYEIPELKIEGSVDKVNVVSSNKNILGIDALTTTINGVEIDINADGTITLNGTSTDAIEFDLNGSSNNLDMLYMIKKEINYAISGLTNNVSLSLYSYDGTDRTLVGNLVNEITTLENTYKITQTTLNIPSGVTFDEVVLAPQIEINEPTSFIKHEETRSSGTLSEDECIINGLMSYSNKTIIMIDEEVTTNIKYHKYKYLNEKFTAIEVSENEVRSTVTEMNETINGQNVAISQVVQKVDEINSKITDIADITTSGESEYATINLENINESEPIAIRVHPINNDISYLYPNNQSFPNDNSFPTIRTLRFTNIETNEYVDYELPDDLLYFDENTYDEFILNYDSKTCSVIKRVDFIDADGNKAIKENEEIIDYEYPTIPLENGNYKVELLGYSKGYIFVQLMAANIYTTQYVTKIELSSSITQTSEQILSEVSAKYSSKEETASSIKQTADSINLEVAKKVDNSTYQAKIAKIEVKQNEISAEVSNKVGNDEIISSINQTAESIKILANKLGLTANDVLNIIAGNEINLTSKNLTIKSNNFNVDKNGNMNCSNAKVSGEINSTTGSIGGWTINSEGLTNGKLFIKNNGYSSVYTFADIIILRNFLLGKLDLQDDEKAHYDLNNDGVTNLQDLLLMRKMILGE